MKVHRLVYLVLVITVAHLACAQEAGRNNPPSIPQRIDNWMTSMDSDQNGTIEETEARGAMQRNFQRLDSDGNGKLDRAELRVAAGRLERQAATRTRPGNQQRNRQSGISDEQLMGLVPDGVKVELNLSYREGNDAWKLDLAMPAEKSIERLPAIVFVHGGGWRNGDKRTSAFLNPTLDYAARGYVCITVNYRLGGPKLDCIQDVKCAVRWLRAHAEKYNVDPERIGAFGNSAGAHLVTMLGISYNEEKLEGDGPWQEYSSRVQAVAASATPTSPGKTAGAEYPDTLIQPMSYITADAPPFLLFHEESDRTVPVSNSDDFVAAMKKAGVEDITYKRYTDGSGHGVFQRNIQETGPIMEAFFRRTIGKG